MLSREALDRGGLGVHPRDVRLVVEVASPSTARVDRTVKRELFAAWGIPAYWVVDLHARTLVRHGDEPSPAWAQALDEAHVLDG